MMNNAMHWLQILEGLLPWIVGALFTVAIAVALVILVLDFLDARRLSLQEYVFLELTPPANTDKTPEATKHLFSVLHGLEASRTLQEKFLRRKVVFSLELVSTKREGIRYIFRVPKNDASTFEQTVLAYLPDAKLRQSDDFTPKGGKVLELKQTGHFAYPLHTQLLLNEHDPMAYLTGLMTKLAPNELIDLQIVVSPTKVREAGVITSRMMHNDELVYKLGRNKMPASKVFNAINTVLFGILDTVGDTMSHPKTYHYQRSLSQAERKQQAALKLRPARVLSMLEQQLAESVHDKLSQPLFSVSIRALIVMDDKEREKQRAKGIHEWLAALAVPKYQSLRVRRTYSRLQDGYRHFLFVRRLPSFFRRNTCIVSAAELADLYHFPHAEVTKTENIVKSLSKTLPAPLSLKNGSKFDVILGRNHHHGMTTDIGLTAAERERHVYIIGGTGNGKTTMIEYSLMQDIRSGKGVAVIDPHGDLAEKLLRQIPEDRINDVVYFNPSDLAYPIGLNLLELPEGLEGDELLDAKDFITEAVISVMRKVFSEDDSGGHRIEYVLRNTVQTALTLKEPTLFTVFDLLTDTKYRNKVTKTLQDQKLKNFWKNEFGKAGDFQRVKMAGGVTAKIGRFQFSASAERIMSQPKSTINFDDILDGKILICNFAKGLIGEDTSELFGVSTLAKLQLAAYRRVKTKQQDRKPFYLYVDEFQNFATMSFVQMLSEARKYKVFLTMAEQSTSQQEDLRMVNTILANVGTVICFRTGNPADERLLLPLFKPYIEEGEIANLPTYNFYARMSAVLSQEPVSGQTILLGGGESEKVAKRIIEASRANYATKHEARTTDAPSREPVRESKPMQGNSEAKSRKPSDD